MVRSGVWVHVAMFKWFTNIQSKHQYVTDQNDQCAESYAVITPQYKQTETMGGKIKKSRTIQRMRMVPPNAQLVLDFGAGRRS